MTIEIECAGCGRRGKLSDEKGQYTEKLFRQGWDSFDGELYCPECMKAPCITMTARLRPDGKTTEKNRQYIEKLLRQGWGRIRGELYCPGGYMTLTGGLRPDGSFAIRMDFREMEEEDDD